MAKKWYIVHAYSGFEEKVKSALKERIASCAHPDKFGQILVPTEKVVELVKGKRKTSLRKFYPGYILVKMELDDETWHLVKNIAKITGFLGGEKPAPVPDREAQEIIDRMKAGNEKAQPKFSFEIGDEIKIIDGPFATFNGIVEEVNQEQGKLKVLVTIFGRSTPVGLEFVQVSKL